MKILVILLTLLFTSQILADTKSELIRQAVSMYLALEQGKDKVELLTYKDLKTYTENGKTYKDLQLNFKMDIASQIYFRRLNLKLQIKQDSKFNILPYSIGVGIGLIVGILLTK